ncbi:unnamed protein product [Caenorhabditis brenneri]
MAEDGYEVLGPAHGPAVPPPLKAPPLAPGQKVIAPPSAPPLKVIEKRHVKKPASSGSDSLAAEATNRSSLEPKTRRGRSRSSMRSIMSEPEESRMESAESYGTAIEQRPNALDTIQLSIMIFVMIIVVAVSITVIIGAKMENIEWITSRLEDISD